MLLATVQNVRKQYGEQVVLRDLAFRISSGRKLGLIGPNGSGKTTILRLLVGEEDTDAGTVVVTNGVRIGYVPQYVAFADEHTVTECILLEHRERAASLVKAEEELVAASDAEMKRALRRYQRVQDDFERRGGYAFPQRAQGMLDALGLADKGPQPVGSLSGGEKNVLALARALLDEPDLLLLDEPANHLDYKGVAWLEDFLQRFRGAVLVVSHNRYLLDRVVDGVLHLENGAVKYYDGGYSDYRAAHLRDLLAQQADYSANQKRLERLEALVQRLADQARNRADPALGKRLRARRSQLAREKEQAVEKPMLVESRIRPDFSVQRSKADIALQLRRYSKAFDDLVLFEDADMDIDCGERVALVGPNGCGKTTLLRDIVAQGAWENPVMRVGPSLSMGYGAQEQEVLDSARSIFEEMMATVKMDRKQAYSLLARFGFEGEDVNKQVSNLSGGERNRLQLARLMVLRPNFLILDEPTNHLDIPVREAVEEALADFKGTILVVSHDRYFLDKVVSRVVEVSERGLVNYNGNFSAFWFARQASMRSAGRVMQRRKERDKADVGSSAVSEAAARLERQITHAEQRKVQLEKQMTHALARNDHHAGRQAARKIEQLEAEIDRLYTRWMDEQ